MSTLEQQADAEAGRGNLAQARVLLERLVGEAPTAARWIKLGSICAATGDLKAALAAVEKGLSFAPFDFMGLLSRASLLERMGVAGFGEAFGRALFHKPAGELGPQLTRMVAHAAAAHAAFLSEHDRDLRAAMASAEDAATPEE